MKKGFTLIEIIMAVVIIAVALLSIAAAYQSVLSKGFRAKAFTAIISLAEEKMDEVLGLDYGDVVDVAETPFDAPFAGYTYEVIVMYVLSTSLDSETVSDTGYKNVEVKISHPQAGTYSIKSVVTDWNA